MNRHLFGKRLFAAALVAAIGGSLTNLATLTAQDAASDADAAAEATAPIVRLAPISVNPVATQKAEAPAAKAVSLASLLDETVDRDALASLPNYVCKQASSYDRAAKSPDENWFANADASQFIRVEQNGDREESVLMEADGPGAIVRWWITAPHYKNNFYVYIDGATEPAFSGNVGDIVGGDALVGAPLSAERSRGRDLYLPIPYAKSIKVTCDKMAEQGNLYYHIDYRTYPEGTAVESFSKAALDAARDQIARTSELLLNPGATARSGETQGISRRIESEQMDGLFEAHRVFGPGALTEIDVKLIADDVPAATRSVLLSISFDGEETVCVPVGEFFGSGVGVNPYKSWFAEVLPDGTMKAYWVAPFKREARVSFTNVGDQDVDVEYSVFYRKRPWVDGKTAYFHANWRQERGIETIAGAGTKDWNYLTVDGRGVYVGDVLSLVNPVVAWWGEGDEKVFVDGESFPSHFGTGSEDYYGYAWGCPEFFEAPFHAQPRAEGPQNFGNTTNLRYRALDGISFEKSLKFDMEVWHWAATNVDYAVTTFWYGEPGAKAVGAPTRDDVEEEAAEPVQYDRKLPVLFELNGLKVDGDSDDFGGSCQVQDMSGFERGQWANGKQVWWTQGGVGNKLKIQAPEIPAGTKKIAFGATVAKDYGRAQFYWNGEKVGEPIDFYLPEGVERRVVELDVPESAEAGGTLTIEIVGKNDASIGTMIGIDSIEAR